MASVFAGECLNRSGAQACPTRTIAGWCCSQIRCDPVRIEKSWIGDFRAPEMDGGDAARIVAQKLRFDERGIARSQDGSPVRMHGIEGQKTGKTPVAAPGGSCGQIGSLDGQSEAEFSMQDDFVLGHVVERLVENALDRRMIQGVVRHAQEP